MTITSLLPFIKQTIKLPEDVDQLEKLNNFMSTLMTDNDRDVAHVARSIHDQFKKMPIRMAGGAGGMLDAGGLTGPALDFESEDRKKELEETDLSLSVEEVERMRADVLGDKRRAALPSVSALLGGMRRSKQNLTAGILKTRGSFPTRSSSDDAGASLTSPTSPSGTSMCFSTAAALNKQRGMDDTSMYTNPGAAGSRVLSGGSGARSTSADGVEKPTASRHAGGLNLASGRQCIEGGKAVAPGLQKSGDSLAQTRSGALRASDGTQSARGSGVKEGPPTTAKASSTSRPIRAGVDLISSMLRSTTGGTTRVGEKPTKTPLSLPNDKGGLKLPPVSSPKSAVVGSGVREAGSQVNNSTMSRFTQATVRRSPNTSPATSQGLASRKYK